MKVRHAILASVAMMTVLGTTPAGATGHPADSPVQAQIDAQIAQFGGSQNVRAGLARAGVRPERNDG
jgi:hypothetical protein